MAGWQSLTYGSVIGMGVASFFSNLPFSKAIKVGQWGCRGWWGGLLTVRGRGRGEKGCSFPSPGKGDTKGWVCLPSNLDLPRWRKEAERSIKAKLGKKGRDNETELHNNSLIMFYNLLFFLTIYSCSFYIFTNKTYSMYLGICFLPCNFRTTHQVYT